MKTKIYFKINGKQKEMVVTHTLPMTRGLMAVCISMRYLRVDYRDSNREKFEEQIEKDKDALFLCKRDYHRFNREHPKHKSVITNAYFLTL